MSYRYRAYSDPLSPTVQPVALPSPGSPRMYGNDMDETPIATAYQGSSRSRTRDTLTATSKGKGRALASEPEQDEEEREQEQEYRDESDASTSHITSLTQASLARLQLSHDFPSRPAKWAYGGHGHGHAQSYNGGGGGGGGRGRLVSITPSTTSVSDGEEPDQEDVKVDVEEPGVKKWLDKGRTSGSASGSGGKGKEREVVGKPGPMAALPPEILVHIFRLLPRSRDVQSALQVSRTWCLCAFSLLWFKPILTDPRQLVSIARVLTSPMPSLPYANHLRRINIASIASEVTDDLFVPLEACVRAERLTIAGASRLTAAAVQRVISKMPGLVSIDMENVVNVDCSVIAQIAKTCDKIQALSINGCTLVRDDGLVALAEKGKMLRRFKAVGCNRLTDSSIVALARSCHLLLEVDLSKCPQITNPSIYALLLNASHLRDLKIQHNTNITDEAFPTLNELYDLQDHELEREAKTAPVYATTASLSEREEEERDGPPRMLRPLMEKLEMLRIVDLTGCAALGDRMVHSLVASAPKIRNLTLAKCPEITDAAVDSILKLGKCLHHLHLGHVASLTDAAVTRIVRTCTRIRYLDLACCPRLTDQSAFEIATSLHKLRRLGLVKVTQLTDEGVYALIERHATLERIHLSYCDNISVNAVAMLLNRLTQVTHLSLTGVSAFKTAEFQQFCRPVPSEYNDHQRGSFCVFSGHGIAALRDYLNMRLMGPAALSDDASTRRGSSSSLSSMTAPAPSPVAVQAYRRGSAPLDRRYHLYNDLVEPGLPAAAFSSYHPNFLPGAQAPLAPSASTSQTHRGSVDRARERDRDRLRDRDVEPDRGLDQQTVMPGAYGSTAPRASPTPPNWTTLLHLSTTNRDSRSSSVSSVEERRPPLSASAAWRERGENGSAQDRPRDRDVSGSGSSSSSAVAPRVTSAGTTSRRRSRDGPRSRDELVRSPDEIEPGQGQVQVPRRDRDRDRHRERPNGPRVMVAASPSYSTTTPPVADTNTHTHSDASSSRVLSTSGSGSNIRVSTPANSRTIPVPSPRRPRARRNTSAVSGNGYTYAPNYWDNTEYDSASFDANQPSNGPYPFHAGAGGDPSWAGGGARSWRGFAQGTGSGAGAGAGFAYGLNGGAGQGSEYGQGGSAAHGRRASDIAGLGSPLKWVAGIVGWGATGDEEIRRE